MNDVKAVGLIVLFVMWVAVGMALADMWNWFLAPTFTTMMVTRPVGIGIVLMYILVRLINIKPTTKVSDEVMNVTWRDLGIMFGPAYIYICILYGAAWAIHRTFLI